MKINLGKLVSVFVRIAVAAPAVVAAVKPIIVAARKNGEPADP